MCGKECPCYVKGPKGTCEKYCGYVYFYLIACLIFLVIKERNEYSF
jgi:hypothetical protein